MIKKTKSITISEISSSKTLKILDHHAWTTSKTELKTTIKTYTVVRGPWYRPYVTQESYTTMIPQYVPGKYEYTGSSTYKSEQWRINDAEDVSSWIAGHLKRYIGSECQIVSIVNIPIIYYVSGNRYVCPDGCVKLALLGAFSSFLLCVGLDIVDTVRQIK